MRMRIENNVVTRERRMAQPFSKRNCRNLLYRQHGGFAPVECRCGVATFQKMIDSTENSRGPTARGTSLPRDRGPLAPGYFGDFSAASLACYEAAFALAMMVMATISNTTAR